MKTKIFIWIYLFFSCISHCKVPIADVAIFLEEEQKGGSYEEKRAEAFVDLPIVSSDAFDAITQKVEVIIVSAPIARALVKFRISFIERGQAVYDSYKKDEDILKKKLKALSESVKKTEGLDIIKSKLDFDL